MTSRLLTSWWRTRELGGATPGTSTGSVAATPTLDWGTSAVQSLLVELQPAEAAGSRAILLRAHALIAARVRPVYALDDLQPVSETLARARGHGVVLHCDGAEHSVFRMGSVSAARVFADPPQTDSTDAVAAPVPISSGRELGPQVAATVPV